MKKFAGWRLWLEGCIGCLALTGTLQAAAPPAHVIATPAEAHAFEDDAPFVFSGQALDVQLSFSSDRPVVLESLAPIIVAPGVHFTLRGELTSRAAPTAAPLHKRGLGTLALTGANRHTSNTVLREGTLRVAGASPLGAPTYNLEQHAGTVLSFAPETRILNFIQVTPTRSGDVPLPGLEGEAEWRVESGQASLVNNVMAQVPIRKTGAGDLRVLDAIMSESFVSVEGGALVLDGSVIGRVDIGPGARLEGRGDFTSARVAGGGMVAPGGRDAAATLSAWRDVVFEPGSLYHVNAYADGRADLLDLFGKATLDGKVWAEAGSGPWAPEHRYRILTAQGGLGDTRFVGVDANLAFLAPELEYDDNNVYLILRRNDLGIGDVGETPEDEEVGDAVESIPLTPLQDAILGMSTDQARAALRGLSGSWQASVRSFLLEDSRYVRDALLAGVASFGDAFEGGAGAAPKPGIQGQTSQMPDLSDAAGVGHAAGKDGTGGLKTWAHAYVSAGRRAAASSVEGDRSSGRGIVLGVDAPVNRHWRVGGVLAAQHAHLRRDSRPASASVGTHHVGLSAHGRWSGMRLTAGLLHAWHRIDSRRRVAEGPLQQVLGATYTGRSWQAVMEIAPRLRALGRLGARLRDDVGAQVAAESGPFLRHDWVRLRTRAFDESGGPGAHGVHAATADMHATTLGWRLRHGFEWKGAPIVLGAEAGWRRGLGNTQLDSTQHFVSAGGGAQTASAPFTSPGQPMARNALAVGVNARAAPWRHAELAARYGGMFGSGQRSHAAWAEFRWKF